MTARPYALFDVTLKRKIPLSPSLCRFTFAGPVVANMRTLAPDQRIKVGLLYRGQIAMLPDDAQTDFQREGFTVQAMRTRGAELTGLVAAMDDLRKTSIELPDIPTTVISGVLYDSGMSTPMRVAASAAHGYRATRSRRGRHVLATRSGHLIP